MLGRTDRRLRHLGLLAVFVCLALALSVRLAYWQVAQGDDLRQRATTQMSRPALEFVQRGDITDRRGTLLATTAYRDLLAAYPDLIAADQRSAVARRLATLLEFEPPQTAKLVETFEKGVPYTIVKRRLTAEQSQLVRDALAAGDVAALSLEPQPVRFYPTLGGAPRTTLASQLLGFVTEDGEGRYGIEQHNHALLAGLDGGTAALEGGPPAGGGTGQQLRLTIDASLQLRIEKELYAIWVANKAERVSAVVMDPRTGQILAWASVPGYDANSYAETARADPGRFVDPLASQIYEPGSVMKMVTAAAALEAGVVRPGSILEDERFLDFGDFKVRNADKRSMGELTFAEVLAYSRNVPTAKVAARLGRDTASASAVLYDMWRRLGLNRASGVEVSSESRGIAADPAIRRWAPVDLANRSFGQGVAVTPVQLAVAFSTMVNGGRHMPAHLVAPADPAAESRGTHVLDAEVSETLRELMVNNVASVSEVASKTLIDGYTVGGKSGTAQYWDSEKNRWAEDTYNYTFCGFVGDGIPDLVIVVTVNKPALTVQKRRLMVPKIESYEVFRRVAQTSISVLDLPPDSAPEPADELPGHTSPADSPVRSPDVSPSASPVPIGGR
ncbi:MAG TPA: penicillin-binding protein 2 [Candidatus Limnocylindrales bacterium]|jgi:cell division protein FtsI/penicillin-binding protein 2|nr:penicillin-binding protein 2 [Candidatus Limnocylindrales bacterium]